MKPILPLLLLVSLAQQAAAQTVVEAEVCICGGTSGGVVAAVQAARMGRRVVIVEPGRHLGGMTSGGLSAVDIGDPRTVSGIAREYFTRLVAGYGKKLEWERPHTAVAGSGHGMSMAGLVVNEPVTSTDLYPTCLAAAGLPARPNQHLDGRNLQPLLSGKGKLTPRSLFWHYPHYNEHRFSVPSSVIRKGEWKLIETFDPDGVELYNLANDLSETKNLATAEPAKVAELRCELDAWRKEVGAEIMKPNPDYDPSALTAKKKKGKKSE